LIDEITIQIATLLHDVMDHKFGHTDADRLDAIGAIGIARAFVYGGATGKLLYSSDKDVGDVIQHFYDKLLFVRKQNEYIIWKK